MIKLRSSGMVALVLMVLWGCGAVDPDAGQDATSNAAPNENVGKTEEELTAAFNRYAVGVVPLSGSSCRGDATVSLYTDDEDDDNESDNTGFDLPQTIRRSRRHHTHRTGTNWTFCKVDGQQFYSLTRYGNVDYYYATLKLGIECPNGSIEFQRQVDGEHNDNRGAISGPAAPNFVAAGGAELFFCLFETNTTKMKSFPDLSMQYAVFHDYDGSQPDLFRSKKWVYSDDEDFHNFNFTKPSSGADFNVFNTIIGGDTNTMYELAQVQ